MWSFGRNRCDLPKEIVEAKNAIIAHARELFEVREELNEVFYTLQAFRSVLGNIVA